MLGCQSCAFGFGWEIAPIPPSDQTTQNECFGKNLHPWSRMLLLQLRWAGMAPLPSPAASDAGRHPPRRQQPCPELCMAKPLSTSSGKAKSLRRIDRNAFVLSKREIAPANGCHSEKSKSCSRMCRVCKEPAFS